MKKVRFRVTDYDTGIVSDEVCEIDLSGRMISYHHNKRDDGSGLCSQRGLDRVRVEISLDEGKTWQDVCFENIPEKEDSHG